MYNSLTKYSICESKTETETSSLLNCEYMATDFLKTEFSNRYNAQIDNNRNLLLSIRGNNKCLSSKDVEYKGLVGTYHILYVFTKNCLLKIDTDDIFTNKSISHINISKLLNHREYNIKACVVHNGILYALLLNCDGLLLFKYNSNCDFYDIKSYSVTKISHYDCVSNNIGYGYNKKYMYFFNKSQLIKVPFDETLKFEIIELKNFDPDFNIALTPFILQSNPNEIVCPLRSCHNDVEKAYVLNIKGNDDGYICDLYTCDKNSTFTPELQIFYNYINTELTKLNLQHYLTHIDAYRYMADSDKFHHIYDICKLLLIETSSHSIDSLHEEGKQIYSHFNKIPIYTKMFNKCLKINIMKKQIEKLTTDDENFLHATHCHLKKMISDDMIKLIDYIPDKNKETFIDSALIDGTDYKLYCILCIDWDHIPDKYIDMLRSYIIKNIVSIFDL